MVFKIDIWKHLLGPHGFGWCAIALYLFPSLLFLIAFNVFDVHAAISKFLIVIWVVPAMWLGDRLVWRIRRYTKEVKGIDWKTFH